MRVLDILNVKGEKVGKLDIKPEIFESRINQDVVYQDIRRLLVNQREGTASTKTRKEVRGGGIKPWRQKGTGRARTGSIRAPHWRGGGIVFGPHPRDFSFSIPKKVRNLALKSALLDKINAQAIIIIDDVKIDQPKTKAVVDILKRLKLTDKKNLFLLDKKDETFLRAVRNIPETSCKDIKFLNTFDILYYDFVVFTQNAFNSLIKKLSDFNPDDSDGEKTDSMDASLIKKGYIRKKSKEKK